MLDKHLLVSIFILTYSMPVAALVTRAYAFCNVRLFWCDREIHLNLTSGVRSPGKKLSHYSITIDCWNICWSVHLLFKQMHTSADISACNKLACQMWISVESINDTIYDNDSKQNHNFFSKHKSCYIKLDTFLDNDNLIFILKDSFVASLKNFHRYIICSPEYMCSFF